MIPPALVLVVLALAAFRTYRLLALDSFPPIARARDRLVGVIYDQDAPRYFRHPLLAEWLTCPWCSGLWWSAGWYAGWLLAPNGAVYAAVPLAISALVGAAQTALPD